MPAADPQLRRAVSAGGAYTVDLDRLDLQLAAFRSGLEAAPVDPVFPIKTLPVRPVLEVFARHGFAFDASNAAELALASGLASRCGFLNGPLAPRAFAGHEAATGAWLPVVSTLVQVQAALHARCPRVGLRIDSSAVLGLLPNRLPSRFGLVAEEIDWAADVLRQAGVRVECVHAHHGSDVLTVENYRTLLEELIKIAAKLGARTVNLGGGQYACVAAGADLAALCVELARALPCGHRLAVEGGGVHLRGCVSLTTEVADVQVRAPLMTVTVATCLAASLQWSRARADMRFPADWPDVRAIRIVGASCDESDSMQLSSWDAAVERGPAPSPGDWLTLRDVSPYAIGRRFAFNGIPAPSVFVIRDGVLARADG